MGNWVDGIDDLWTPEQVEDSFMHDIEAWTD